MLNRLLDDNRELMIPDTQEVIKPHSDFAIFATQNPTGVYVYQCFVFIFDTESSNICYPVNSMTLPR
jgi:hypothetical protein